MKKNVPTLFHFQISLPRHLKKITFLFFILQIFSGQGQLLKKDSVTKDISVLYSLLNTVHLGQFMHCSKTDFDSCYDSLMKSIKSDLLPIDFYCKAQFLAAKIKDGHTMLPHSKIRLDMRDKLVFPFSLYNRQGSFIIRKSGEAAWDTLIGYTVTSINNRPVKDVVAQAVSVMSIEGENESAINQYLQWLPFYYFLSDTSSRFLLQMKDRDGKGMQILIPGIPYKSFDKRIRKIVEPIQKEFISPGIAILTVNTFGISDFESSKIDYKKYIDDFFRQLHKQKTDKLIIDVRNNMGGAPEVSNYLFSYLINRPYYYFEYVGKKYKSSEDFKRYCTTPGDITDPDTIAHEYDDHLFCQREGYWWFEQQQNKKKNFSGKLIVITNGGCYSTTGHFLTLLKDNSIGLLMGEYSQGSFYSNDGGLMFQLPYSKFLVKIPVAQFKMKTTNFKYDPKGICPDIEVKQEMEDLITGSDRQLSEAQKQFNK